MTSHSRVPGIASRIAAARRSILTIAAAAAALFALADVVVPTALAGGRTVTLAQNSSQPVEVPKGKSVTVRTEVSFADIVVGDPEVAMVEPLTDKSLYIIGKKIGATSVAVFDEQRQLVGEIEVEVASDNNRLSEQLRRNIPSANIKVLSVNGRIMLSGTAPDSISLKKALAIAEEYGDDVINSITIGRPQQVLLEVRFIEAFRNSEREVGVNWDVIGSGYSVFTGVADLVSGSTPFGSLLGTVLRGGVQADTLIQALEQRGLARRLAEPNLIALSGNTATFLAGGEFPFPVQADKDTVTLEFKKFGVGLSFTPTVLADDVINLRIDPEVSQLDTTNVVKLSGIEIPSLIVRRASTTVELRDGQSFVIAGLLQSSADTSREQVPWLGDVPVLGALFSSSAYRRQQTDLAIIVTPRLVRPLTSGDQVRTPLDDTWAANDVDFFLFGMGEVKKAKVHFMHSDNPDRPWAGHILDLPRR